MAMLKYAAALVSVLLAVWWSRELDWLEWSSWRRDAELVRLLTEDELALHGGVYLAILGQVFDVEKGRKHYGPDGAYRFFTGRDASRAFVTGDFSEEGLTDDVSDLTPSQIVALYDWLAFYQNEYRLKGRLVGRFYSDSGRPTDALRRVEASLAEGLKLKQQADEEKQFYPACNSEWSSERGGRVWCSNKSGGVHRHWVGVPRKLFSPGSGNTRCVCTRLDDPMHLNNPNLQQYKDCLPDAESCSFS